MIETTYLRLERAAELLKVHSEEMLLAAAENRIRLFGILGEYVEATPYFDYGGDSMVAGEKEVKFFGFVPLRYNTAFDAMKGVAETRVSLLGFDASGPEPVAWWDLREPEFEHRVSLRELFVKRSDVDRLMAEGTPEADKELREPTRHLPADKAHVSDDLRILNQAAFMFWGPADRDDPTTQPANGAVIAWLEKQGLSKSKAERGASIIRPEWAHNGRRPES